MNIEEIAEAFASKDEKRFADASSALVGIVTMRNLDINELASLCLAIADSGEKIITNGNEIKADVPSTGAPGSLSTLLCPILLAADGITVPKLSASGSVAGGIDTMGLLKGYRMQLWGNEFKEVLKKVGYAHARPSSRFCPADNALIKIRKVHHLMECAPLAAISLLSKKLAIPGTAAAFDFRVGPTGNIGDTKEAGERVAGLFHEVARKLGINISVRLTDNRRSPSSALGRHESLNLLVAVLKTEQLSELDSSHVNTCLKLVADAVLLAKGGNREEVMIRLRQHLTSKRAWCLFCEHITAQGALPDAVEISISLAKQRKTFVLTAPSAGFWIPPNLKFAKDWIKRANEIAAGTPGENLEPGVRFLAPPLTLVEAAQPIVEIALPSSAIGKISIPHELLGSISPEEPIDKPFESYVK